MHQDNEVLEHKTVVGSPVSVRVIHNDKILELEELASKIAVLHAKNQKVVQCHGIFDLLHIGHIRHFEQAKKLGDVLIVTVTPDRYVNKGPHRPVFKEDLRVEAIAALDCVDYVALNRWSTAIEAIKILKPDFYVKGSEYKETEKDHTGGILLEEMAIKSVGGQLSFTNDITFSSSNLINRHLSSFPKQVTDYLTKFSERYSLEDVLHYLDLAKSLKVLVVGDSIIDEYQYLQAIGKSSKEPMLAVKHLQTEKFAGGILAVAGHVKNFSDQVGLVTFLGEKNSQDEFIREKINRNIEKIFLYRKNSPTIVKRRFIEEYYFTKLMEVYEINDAALEEADNEMLCTTLRERVPDYDVVMVVDFGHGMLTREAINILCNESRFLVLNVQSNAGNLGYHTVSKYLRADYISMTEPEIRLETRDRHGRLRDMVLEVSNKLSCDHIAITRGKNGCLCYRKDEGFFEVPAFAGDVVDRMGAGDSFLSITALCVAEKAPMELVGFIGNAVGAQAVAMVGNRKAIDRVALIKHIECLLK